MSSRRGRGLGLEQRLELERRKRQQGLGFAEAFALVVQEAPKRKRRELSALELAELAARAGQMDLFGRK